MGRNGEEWGGMGRNGDVQERYGSCVLKNERLLNSYLKLILLTEMIIIDRGDRQLNPIEPSSHAINRQLIILIGWPISINPKTTTEPRSYHNCTEIRQLNPNFADQIFRLLKEQWHASWTRTHGISSDDWVYLSSNWVSCPVAFWWQKYLGIRTNLIDFSQ